MVSLSLVCLVTSILYTAAKIIFQKNHSELGLSLLYKLGNVAHSLSSRKQSTQTLKSSTIWAQSTILVLFFTTFLYIDIHLSSNSTTIFSNILCLFLVSMPVLKVFSPNDIFLPSTLILPTIQNLPQMFIPMDGVFSEGPLKHDLFIL